MADRYATFWSVFGISSQEEDLFEKMEAPTEFLCKIQTCPEKLKAQDMKIFMVSEKKNSSIRVELPKKVVRKMRSNEHLYGFYSNGAFSIYHSKKGFIKY